MRNLPIVMRDTDAQLTRSLSVFRTATSHARHAAEEPSIPAGTDAYEALDLRLMDTFPASDAVARY